MLVLCIFFSVVLISVLYILFAPIYVEIDSINSVYRIRMHRLIGLSFFVNNNASLIEIKIAFWRKVIDLSKATVNKEEVPLKNERKGSKSFSSEKLLAIIKSFKVNRLDATFDLGDMQWNGIFYPLFCWLSYKTGKNICINFQGKNSIVLQIENNIARMSRAFICS